MTLQGRLHRFGLRLRGVRTLALVGKSGTGKSFRASLLAEKHGIEVIIDDGLIIRDRTILYGETSKKESTMRSAVRRALFDEPASCAQARRALSAARFRKALILGTSVEMAGRIAFNLGLPHLSEIFFIQDVAAPEEIDRARRKRRHRKVHSLPLPPVKVRMGLRSSVGSRVRVLAARVSALRGHLPLPPKVLQTSQARPAPGVVFTESAITQMVHHCIQEYDHGLSLGKLILTRRGALHALEVGIKVGFRQATSGDLHTLKEFITSSLGKYAGILAEVTVIVESIEKNQ
jgi:ABC-type oligopeptide transport system ATPase subunit